MWSTKTVIPGVPPLCFMWNLALKLASLKSVFIGVVPHKSLLPPKVSVTSLPPLPDGIALASDHEASEVEYHCISNVSGLDGVVSDSICISIPFIVALAGIPKSNVSYE